MKKQRNPIEVVGWSLIVGFALIIVCSAWILIIKDSNRRNVEIAQQEEKHKREHQIWVATATANPTPTADPKHPTYEQIVAKNNISSPTKLG